jgi:hypothetical protein
MKANRPWCAVAQYPGLQRFLVGTVVLPHNAKSHEIEKALVVHALTFLPEGFTITEVKCGALFFQSEDSTC